jgi:hypothetical protein
MLVVSLVVSGAAGMAIGGVWASGFLVCGWGYRAL